MKKILIITPYYLPGYKAGGPIRSISNLIDRYKNKYEFSVMTPNRDLDGTNYSNILSNKWNNIYNTRVYYVGSYIKFLRMLRQYSNEIDIIYLNSMFSLKYSIIIIIFSYLKIINVSKIIIAPRGEFAVSALNIKKIKKKIYLAVSKIFRLHKKVIWHTTGKKEFDEVKKIFNDGKIVIADNISSNDIVVNFKTEKIIKEKNELHIVVIARIVPIKNLLFSLEIMQTISKNISVYFDIYGPIEDKLYWDKCQAIIDKLPKNIIVKYKGSINNEDVLNTIKKYHLYLLPTHCENFGHSIVESFKSSCPVLISDNTPWRNLESKNIGWDISLSNKKRYTDIIEYLALLSHQEIENISMNVHSFITEYFNNTEVDYKYRELFK